MGVPLNIPLHPTQLYESLGELAIFALLMAAIVRPRRPGAILGLYLLLYSALRFGVEFVRAHDQANPFGGPLSIAQWISLALIAAVLGARSVRRGRAVPARNAG
ncbi:MAG: prolipoprotein diacylglyceryl transferase family protein [Bryobacteraceae bacterium]